MLRFLQILSFIFLIQTTAFGQNPLDTISAYQASTLIGQEVIIKGKIVSVFYAKDSEGKPTFLNLEKFYPNNPVAVIIFKDQLDRLNINVDSYVNKTVILKGKMEAYKNKTPPYNLKPNITISRLNQIIILK